MIRLALALAATITATTSKIDAPEPIHKDEGPYAVIEPTSRYLNATTKPYIMGHQEPRHVNGRPKEVCFKLTNNVVTDDFIKCRNGYDYKAWVPGHYTD